MSDKHIEKIQNKVRQDLDKYFLKFCSLDAMQHFPQELKSKFYYYVIENIIPYIYESSFKEVLTHPNIIKKIRKSVAMNWIMFTIFIFGFISGATLGTLLYIIYL